MSRTGELARALNAQRMGGAMWMARCPAHRDNTPSLAISEGRTGRPVVHCHAGCSQQDVIAALRDLGLWSSGVLGPGCTTQTAPSPAQPLIETPASSIWERCQSAHGTPVETYLKARGIALRGSSMLRFHPALRHASGSTWPAMVALVTSGIDAEPIAIHRTFLARDGSGKAPVEPAKMMLGPCRGGAVRLGEATDLVMVGEGIETCLSAMQATGHPAWAALSTSGLRALDLPKRIRNIIVLADGDAPGEAAALAAARRWVREGRHVRIARPPAGHDFNDVLRRHGLHGEAA